MLDCMESYSKLPKCLYSYCALVIDTVYTKRDFMRRYFIAILLYIYYVCFFNYAYLWCLMSRYLSEMTKIKRINQYYVLVYRTIRNFSYFPMMPHDIAMNWNVGMNLKWPYALLALMSFQYFLSVIYNKTSSRLPLTTTNQTPFSHWLVQHLMSTSRHQWAQLTVIPGPISQLTDGPGITVNWPYQDTQI